MNTHGNTETPFILLLIGNSFLSNYCTKNSALCSLKCFGCQFVEPWKSCKTLSLEISQSGCAKWPMVSPLNQYRLTGSGVDRFGISFDRPGNSASRSSGRRVSRQMVSDRRRPRSQSRASTFSSVCTSRSFMDCTLPNSAALRAIRIAPLSVTIERVCVMLREIGISELESILKIMLGSRNSPRAIGT